MAKAQVQVQNDKSSTNNTQRLSTKNRTTKKCCDLCTCACPNYVKKYEAEIQLCPLFTQGCKIKGEKEGVELVPLLEKRKRPVTRSGKTSYQQLCCLQKFLLHIH